MRKLVLKQSMSVDGFVAGENGKLDWMFRTSSPGSREWTLRVVSDASLHLMGRKTYRDMLAWWPTSTDMFAPAMNSIPKAVFTRRGSIEGDTTQAVKDAEAARETNTQKADPEVLRGWQQPYVAKGPLVNEINHLKEGDDKPLFAHGGAEFVRSLLAAGVVDEMHLIVHPVVLGRGLPLFDGSAMPCTLELTASTTFSLGIVANTYRVVRS